MGSSNWNRFFSCLVMGLALEEKEESLTTMTCSRVDLNDAGERRRGSLLGACEDVYLRSTRAQCESMVVEHKDHLQEKNYGVPFVQK